MTDHADRHRDDRGSFFGPFRRHPWLTLIAALAVLSLLFVFLVLPPLIRWGLDTWLESHGKLEAEIEDVDFNLFSGYLTVHSLVAERKTGGMQWGRATVEIRWRPVFSKRVRLDDITLVNARVDIELEEDGALYVGGLRVRNGDDGRPPAAASEETDDGWQVGFGAVDLQDVTLRYITPAGITKEMAIEKLNVGPFQVWNPAESSRFDGVVAVGEGRMEIEGHTRPYAEKAGIEGRLIMKDISLGWAAPLFQDLPVDDPEGTLAADVAFDVKAGKTPPLAVRLDGTLSLGQAGGEVADVRFGPSNLSWKGMFELAAARGNAKGPRMSAEGLLEAGEVVLKLAAPALTVDAAALRVEGAYALNPGDAPDGAPYVFDGRIALDALTIADAGGETVFAAADHITLQGVNLPGGGLVGVDRTQFDGIALLTRSAKDGRDASAACRLPSVVLEAFTMDPSEKRLAVETVTLTDAYLRVLRQADGRLEIAALLPETDKEPTREEPSTPWTYRVGALSIEKDAVLVFRDASVSPVVDLAFSQLHATVRQLDSASPQEASTIRIRADIGNYGALHASGDLRPFGGAVSMDVEGEIERFSLPEVRAYIERMWGYTIKSGQLYADVHLRAEQAELDSVVKLYITSLVLERQREEELDEITEQLGMPLGTALNLIRDGDGHIRLRLPITGSFARPDIGLGDVIGTALKKATFQAVKTAALSYFAPLGAAYAATKILGKITALQLKPVFFEAGEAALDAENRDYLQEVAAKLKDRPEARLVLCGKAVPRDREALRQADAGASSASATEGEAPASAVGDQQLLDLAESRAEAVRAFLVDEGIGAERLALCAPDIASRDSRPRVDLAL